MTTTRAALVAAVATTVLWIAKAIAIGLAGGLGRSLAEGPLFLLGLASCVATVVLIGLALASRRTTGWKVVSVVAAVVAVSVFGVVEGTLVAALRPAHPGWAWGEINLWVLMLALLAVATRLAVRRDADERIGVLAPHRP